MRRTALPSGSGPSKTRLKRCRRRKLTAWANAWTSTPLTQLHWRGKLFKASWQRNKVRDCFTKHSVGRLGLNSRSSCLPLKCWDYMRCGLAWESMSLERGWSFEFSQLYIIPSALSASCLPFKMWALNILLLSPCLPAVMVRDRCFWTRCPNKLSSVGFPGRGFMSQWQKNNW